MKRKFLSLVVVMAMLIAFVPCIYAAAIVDSGTCGAQGDNLTWTLDDEGTLTISGTGEMANWMPFSAPYSPWESNESIQNVSINTEVMSIGNFAFYGCKNIKTISIPNSVSYIGDDAFGIALTICGKTGSYA